MRRYAILIEYELPDDLHFADAVVSPALDVIRHLPHPATPVLVSAFADEAAEAMAKAREETT